MNVEETTKRIMDIAAEYMDKERKFRETMDNIDEDTEKLWEMIMNEIWFKGFHDDIKRELCEMVGY